MEQPAIHNLRRLAIALAFSLVACAGQKEGGDGRSASATGQKKRLVVLGIDGMDPTLANRFMEAGRMPNLSALARSGAYSKLGTSSPPESPVAWSDFITSQRAEGHGIYDFVHRDIKTMSPYLSTSRVNPPKTTLRLGSLALPIGGGDVELLRKGRPFWSYLDDAGVPTTILMIPASYPASEQGKTRLIAGMGTPDLLGTYGVFQLFTTDPEWKDKQPSGGKIHYFGAADAAPASDDELPAKPNESDFERGVARKLELHGPPDPTSPTGATLKSPFVFAVDEKEPVALVRFGKEERLLQPGEWSDWLPVSFDAGLIGGSISGMVRVYLKSLTPHATLYVSPLNLDPTAPAQSFATQGFAEDLAAAVGRYHTIGIPEDVKALEAGALSDEEYLKLVEYIFQERQRIANHALDTFKDGLLFIYFGTIDQLSHAYWRTMDPDAPAEVKKLAHVIPDFYSRVDEVIGRVIARVGPETPVLVLSDHGFASYDTKVNLNTWLKQNGYLAEKEGTEPSSNGPLDHIDWSKTRAYALGLNLLYVNLRGREPKGIVPPEERDALLAKIKTELEALKHPGTRERVVTRVLFTKDAPHADRRPDAIIGYSRGYRSSDASAVGALTATVFERNEDKWRGDHCIDADLVPGLVASTFRMKTDGASLVDIGPTILDFYGVPAPPGLAGKTLLDPRSKR